MKLPLDQPPNLVYKTGNILDDDATVLVIPVNVVGKLGKGLAAQFRDWAKEKYPELLPAYYHKCKTKDVWHRLLPGWPDYYRTDDGERTIVFFPTKEHWQNPSKLEWIQVGLNALSCRNIFAPSTAPKTIAFCRLGCGEGGLDFEDVRPLLEAFAERHGNVEVRVYV